MVGALVAQLLALEGYDRAAVTGVIVGTVVPRSVRIAPLPATLVSIEPSWRGYMYFVYNEEIVIVEPGTLRIVEVIIL